MATAVSIPSLNYSSLSSRLSITSPDGTTSKVFWPNRNISTGCRVISIRAQNEKPSKKMVEGVVVNKYGPKDPYIGQCLENIKITGYGAPEEFWHMIFYTNGNIPYREGQSIGIIPDGVDDNGKPHKLRLYRIASSGRGDRVNSKTVSLCVKRPVYTNDQVERVCSNFLCDLQPGAHVKITGPVGKEMLMPKDPSATIIMLAIDTGIAPFRSFLWKIFYEEHDDYKFKGLAWLFLGAPTRSSLLYHSEFRYITTKAPKNFKVTYAISREHTDEKGEMYFQTRVAQYAEQLWELLKKDNTYVYMCGLKGMEKGIDDIMIPLATKDGIDWLDYKRQLKKSEQWTVEVYM